MSLINTKKRTYIRDGRAPEPANGSVSKVMSGNKAKNTKPELLLRKRMWSEGMRGYRLHWKKVPGRPDICFPAKKIAIFINGCFWHRCPDCALPLPKLNQEFWSNKFVANIERDKRKIEQLNEKGWDSIVVWECKIKKDLDAVLDTIIKMIKK